MPDERTPLLQFPGAFSGQGPFLESEYGDHHMQFCKLVGAKPLNLPPGAKYAGPGDESLYARAVRHRRNQSLIYNFTATLSNTLLLTQVVLGAALTGLGASDSSRVLITVFGALNTVIAGLVAYLKSRGQPMRARMYRDDLERVVDEIENSAVMWLGISKNVHGYDAIDIDDQVTVRGEVARLTRLYDRAIRTNSMNDPDMYAAGAISDAANAALKSRPMPSQANAPVIPPPSLPIASNGVAPAPPTAPVAADPDESPASKAKPPAPSPPEPAKGKENSKAIVEDAHKEAPPADTLAPKADAPVATPPPETPSTVPSANPPTPSAPAQIAPPQAVDSDASPATAAVLPKAKKDAPAPESQSESKGTKPTASDESPKKESQSTAEPDDAK